jgi:hypothetical protein
MKKPSPVVTSQIAANAAVFTPEDEASLIGAAAAVAESDAGEDGAIETYGRKLGPAPTLVMFVHAQKVVSIRLHASLPVRVARCSSEAHD